MDYILSLYNWSSDIKTSPFRIYSFISYSTHFFSTPIPR
nr:MAG TPA: hypothetical protein [Caudoviricetes sp.]